MLEVATVEDFIRLCQIADTISDQIVKSLDEHRRKLDRSTPISKVIGYRATAVATKRQAVAMLEKIERSVESGMLQLSYPIPLAFQRTSGVRRVQSIFELQSEVDRVCALG